MKRFLISFCFLCFFGCKSDHSTTSDKEEKPLKEGALVDKFSVFSIDTDAFSYPLPEMDSSQKIDFKLGERLFKTNWVPAPASTSGLDGLGPTFVSKSCQICHIRNGRGMPHEKSRKESFGFLMRLSVQGEDENGGPKPVKGYGIQLQNKGILTVKGEADINLNYKYIKGTYPDGTPYELRKPTYTVTNGRYGTLPSDLLLSPRVGQQVIGLGFIDALSEEEILKNADENDANGDGISGRANYAWNVQQQKKTIGKFGWKANTPTLRQQIAGAFHQDIGITTPMFPEQNCPEGQDVCKDLPTGNDDSFEVTEQGLNDITFFLSTVSVPERRDCKDKDVMMGKALFHKINCVGCHAVGLKVGKSEVFPKMKGITINPYSDILLHDMGEGLADNRPDFLANGREWRTQPLWGIGLIKTVNRHTFFLHDGRARSVEEAILWHGGEAEKPKKEFMNLSKKEREQLLKFIHTL
ncbi:MAG: c-type cytochrome [Flavobacteriaceae bacterium]|nr:c-type cytochrome [Flavobacteriaceae bacterium]